MGVVIHAPDRDKNTLSRDARMVLLLLLEKLDAF